MASPPLRLPPRPHFSFIATCWIARTLSPLASLPPPRLSPSRLSLSFSPPTRPTRPPPVHSPLATYCPSPFSPARPRKPPSSTTATSRHPSSPTLQDRLSPLDPGRPFPGPSVVVVSSTCSFPSSVLSFFLFSFLSLLLLAGCGLCLEERGSHPSGQVGDPDGTNLRFKSANASWSRLGLSPQRDCNRAARMT